MLITLSDPRHQPLEFIPGRIVIVSGPSGSGKTTLHKMLLASPKLKDRLVKSISATTRLPRAGERDGKDYIFLTPNQFLSHRRQGYFLEWQKVFNQYYGTPNRCVQQLLRQGKNVLLCIDVKGARVAWRKHPRALKIFIKVPSLAILKKRLLARGTEDPSDLALRLATARKEMQEARHYDHVIVNDRLREAYRHLEQVVLHELGAPRHDRSPA